MKRKFMVVVAIVSLVGGVGWQVASAATKSPGAVSANSQQTLISAGGNDGCGQGQYNDNCCGQGQYNDNCCGQDGGQVKSNGNDNNNCCDQNGGKATANEGNGGGNDGNGGGQCYGPNAPAITTSSSSCHRGNSLTVNGTNFAGHESITLTLDSSPVVTLGTTSTNSGGSFSTPVKIPSSVKPGKYTLAAAGSTGDSAVTELNVT